MNRDFASGVTNHSTSVNRSEFVPIPELFRPDGDVQVIFLIGNGIRFYEQTEDAWYRGTALGHTIFAIGTGQKGSRITYWPEETASPLGCVQQNQFCNTALASDKQCGPLAGWNDAISESAPLFNMTGLQVFDQDYLPDGAIGSQFIWLCQQLKSAATSLETLLQILGPDSLASRANLAQGIMGRLPLNQWQLDVTHWWSTYLASVQAAFVETAIGPADPSRELEQYKFVPWNDHVRKLCNNQVCEMPGQFLSYYICTSHVHFNSFLSLPLGIIVLSAVT